MFDSERKHLFKKSEPAVPALWACLAIALLAGFLLFFANLHKGDLWEESEGNYAEIPREMLELGDWVIPHLNYVPYLEKPPLFYWLTAGAYKTFGPSVFTARLWSALPALLLVLSVFAFLTLLRARQDGLIAALILATSIGMIAMARISYMDMLLCLCTAGAFMGFYLALWTQGRPKKIWFLFSVIALGLAVLTKGLIGLLLPAMGIGLYLVLQKIWGSERNPSMTLKGFPWILGIFLFLALVLPWHLAAGAKNPKFYWFYFINEHWLRFLGQRMPKDYYGGPFYYQFLRTLLLFLPWSLFLPIVFWKRTKELLRDPLTGFLAAWFLAFLLFYSLSKAKANYYMMGAMPALAMLLGLSIQDTLSSRLSSKRLWLMGTALVSLASLAFYVLMVLHPYPVLKKFAPGSCPLLLSSSFLLSVLALCSFFMARGAQWKKSFGFLVAGMVLSSSVLFSRGQIFDRRGSVLPLVELIAANEGSDTWVVLRGTFEKNSPLAFYRQKGFTIVSDQGDVGGDLDFGARFLENKGRFIQWADFLQRFGGPEKILYITWRDADCPELQGNHPDKYHWIGTIAQRSLVSNFPPKTFQHQ